MAIIKVTFDEDGTQYYPDANGKFELDDTIPHPHRFQVKDGVLVDIFDDYEKVRKGFVDKEHLDMRIHMLKLGTMKAPIARRLWDYWKDTRSIEFIEWFEKEIYGECYF